jgi:hypothetical protein
LFLGDWHVPYHDARAVDLAMAFASWFQPTSIYVLGDFLDCYPLSTYDRDPSRLTSLQNELDQGKALLKRLRAVAGRKCQITYLDGNHEFRLSRYLCRHPELSSLSSLNVSDLLDLPSLGITHHAYHTQLRWCGLLVEHGDLISPTSGGSAKKMLESRGVSGISGHVHRLGSHFRTDHRGTLGWWENGCLCQPWAEWKIGPPNYQQGFSVGHGIPGKNRFVVEQVPIIKGRLFYAGQCWESTS